jgi:hypothetical protein
VVFVFSWGFIFSMAFKLASLVFLAAKRKSPTAAASRGKIVLYGKRNQLHVTDIDFYFYKNNLKPQNDKSIS